MGLQEMTLLGKQTYDLDVDWKLLAGCCRLYSLFFDSYGFGAYHYIYCCKCPHPRRKVRSYPISSFIMMSHLCMGADSREPFHLFSCTDHHVIHPSLIFSKQ